MTEKHALIIIHSSFAIIFAQLNRFVCSCFCATHTFIIGLPVLFVNSIGNFNQSLLLNDVLHRFGGAHLIFTKIVAFCV